MAHINCVASIASAVPNLVILSRNDAVEPEIVRADGGW